MADSVGSIEKGFNGIRKTGRWTVRSFAVIGAFTVGNWVFGGHDDATSHTNPHPEATASASAKPNTGGAGGQAVQSSGKIALLESGAVLQNNAGDDQFNTYCGTLRSDEKVTVGAETKGWLAVSAVDGRFDYAQPPFMDDPKCNKTVFVEPGTVAQK